MNRIKRMLCRIGLHRLECTGWWFYEGCATQRATGFECRWCGSDWALVWSYLAPWFWPPRIVKRTLAQRVKDERERDEFYARMCAGRFTAREERGA